MTACATGSSVDGDDLCGQLPPDAGQGFGPEVKRRIMLGTYALSAGYYDAYYLKASKVRTLIKHDFDQALEQCDVLVAPTTPTTAFKIGEKVDDPLQMYLQDVFTLSLPWPGLPGLSLPCGFDEAGCPSACRSWAGPLTRRRSCGWPTPTSRRPSGTLGDRVNGNRRSLCDVDRVYSCRHAACNV